ncbi:MAG: YggU family protein [Desulfuromonadales bacterium]|nr:YggU family protein [Desulfuromonadales bacterium]MBN2793376.1 YggU family protein [Desulfuromonadales bacterium]
MLSCLDDSPQGVIIRLKVQPRASKNQVVGLHGDDLKIKLTAPPVDGAANQYCCAFLAKLFGVAKSHVNIVSGEHARSKKVRIDHMDSSCAEKILRTVLHS